MDSLNRKGNGWHHQLQLEMGRFSAPKQPIPPLDTFRNALTGLGKRSYLLQRPATREQIKQRTRPSPSLSRSEHRLINKKAYVLT